MTKPNKIENKESTSALLSVKAISHLFFELDASSLTLIESKLLELKMLYPNYFDSLIKNSSKWWHETSDYAYATDTTLSFNLVITLKANSSTPLPSSKEISFSSAKIEDNTPDKGVLSPSHLIIIIENKNFQFSHRFLAPLEFVLKTNEHLVTAPDSYQVYEHIFFSKNSIKKVKKARNAVQAKKILFRDYKIYIGLTKRTWQTRYKEHLRAARKGSKLLFHSILAKPITSKFQVGGIEHSVLRCGTSAEAADVIEEQEVSSRSWVKNFPKNGLNMIPGGHAGYEYLKQGGQIPRAKRVNRKGHGAQTYSEVAEDQLFKIINPQISTKPEHSQETKIESRSKTYVTSFDRNKSKLKDPQLLEDSLEKIVTKRNQSLKSGDVPELSAPPIAQAKNKEVEAELNALKEQIQSTINKINSCDIITQRKLSLSLVENAICWSKSLLEVRHCCGTASYFFWSSIEEAFKKNDLTNLCCQQRKCWEEQTQNKLQPGSHMPSRVGIEPGNKKDIILITKEISDLSEGLLIPVPESWTGVRSSFICEITTKLDSGVKFLLIGGHNTYKNRNLYQKRAIQVTQDKFNRKIKTFKSKDEAMAFLEKNHKKQ